MPFLQIRAMKINLARIRQPDEPVALTNQEVHNPTGHERATRNIRPRQFARPRWRAPAPVSYTHLTLPTILLV